MPIVGRECLRCGETFHCERWQPKRYCTQSCGSKFPRSEEHKRKIGDANRGNCWTEEQKQAFANRRKSENNPNWRGGTTQKTKVIRNQREYKLWRAAVLKRDRVCVRCGARESLEVDHIKPQYLYPELVFDINNGRVLCAPCHRDTPTYGPRVKREKVI